MQRVISTSKTICFTSSLICRLVHSYKVNVDIATSFDLMYNPSVSLSGFIALTTVDIKMMARKRPLKVRRRTFVL